MNGSPMRIGIACYPTYGGSGVVATELGRALAEGGHEVHFLSYEFPIRLRSFSGNFYYHQVQVPEYPLFKYPPYALALATEMAEVAEQNGLDILHVHYAIPHAVSGYLAQEMANAEFRMVVTLHGTDITIVGNDPSYRRVTRFAIEKSNGVTAVSKYLADTTRETFGTTCDIEVIPNFIDIDRFDSGTDASQCCLRQNDEKVVMHVSNFRPVKCVTDLVEAFAIVARTIDARLVMIGDGPERPRAQALATDLGISERVHFLGMQEGVERILPEADLFALPSRYESFGLAALEAMACGVPVIGSRAGGLPEVVEDGVTGALCDVGDVPCLAKTMTAMLSDDVRLEAMAKAAYRRARDVFSLEQILPRYEAFYRRVLEQ